MKEHTIDNATQIEDVVFNKSKLEKLVITNSNLRVPEAIGQLTALKELWFTNNTITHIPTTILDLESTFIVFENNEPKIIQQLTLLIFDLQWKKITKPQATLYLKLLQNDIADITIDAIDLLIQALDYRIEQVQEAALELLSNILPMEPIAKKSVVTILGKSTMFTPTDIKPRLKNVSVSYQNKITTKTTHIILCKQPNLQDKTIDSSKIMLCTVNQFINWLNTADKQLLSKKTEENTTALENVSEMLLGNTPEHVALALTMMKTHGISKELLTDLYIFFNTTKDTSAKRKAKTLFKKHASKELLTFFSENKRQYYSTMEGFSQDITFYDFLEQYPVMDGLKIAFHLHKDTFITLAKNSNQIKEFLSRFIIDGTVLDLHALGYLPKEIKDIPGIKALICSKTDENIPDWMGYLDIEKLDLHNLYKNKLPDTFSNLKNLRHIRLPRGKYKPFPKVLTKIPTLEVLEINEYLFPSIPNEIGTLKNLKQIIVCLEHFNKEIPETLLKRKTQLLPNGCEIIIDDTVSSRTSTW